MLTIGVLALQGSFRNHRAVIESLGERAVEVRDPAALEGLDGLIVPGGESTTIGQLAVELDLLEPIRAAATSGLPLWGTCAGMVLMAQEVGRSQPLLALLPLSIRRNGFGRQVQSFEADLTVPVLGDPPFRGIFIRAPYVASVGEGVEILATLPEGTPVAVQRAHLLATAFHPELSGDSRWHQHFLRLVRGAAAPSSPPPVRAAHPGD